MRIKLFKKIKKLLYFKRLIRYFQIYNLNSMNRSIASEQELKKAIEEQLDLILKIEEDRKLLKR